MSGGVGANKVLKDGKNKFEQEMLSPCSFMSISTVAIRDRGSCGQEQWLQRFQATLFTSWVGWESLSTRVMWCTSAFCCSIKASELLLTRLVLAEGATDTSPWGLYQFNVVYFVLIYVFRWLDYQNYTKVFYKCTSKTMCYKSTFYKNTFYKTTSYSKDAEKHSSGRIP